MKSVRKRFTKSQAGQEILPALNDVSLQSPH